MWTIINHNYKFYWLILFANKEQILIIIYNLPSSNNVMREKKTMKEEYK